MLLTRNEMIGLITFAIRKTATTIGIKDADWKSTDELLAEIQAKDADTCNLLNQFIEAYSQWFAFHEDIEHLGKSGNLSSNEQQLLVQKVQTKEDARQAILTRINQITEQHTGTYRR